jgi:hypothetical protein
MVEGQAVLRLSLKADVMFRVERTDQMSLFKF